MIDYGLNHVILDFQSIQDVPILPNDSRFEYEGRWIKNVTTSHGNAAFADWPCSSIHFQVEIECSESKMEDSLQMYVEVLMFNLRTRMVAKIHSLSEVNDEPKEQYILGNISFKNYQYTVQGRS